MPSAQDINSAPHRLLTTIYRQNWPPPAKTSKLPSHGTTRENRDIAGNLRKGSETFGSRTKNQINRPFSASLISPRQQKKGQLMTARRPSSSLLDDVKGLKSSTFKKVKSPTKPRVPEYDGTKHISESASARNKALAAEYLAMLSGRNYLKRQYRDHYWNNETTLNQRRPATRSHDGRRYRTLYPDLGSIVGNNKPVVPAAPNNSAGPWHFSSSPAKSQSPSISNQTTAENVNNNESTTSISELGITYTLKRSWSNIPSGQCYRVLSQPNDTLASLCLEGRPASRTSTRTSSLSSTVSLSGVAESTRKLSSAGESSPSGSSEIIGAQSRGGSGDEEHIHSYIFGGTEDSINDLSKVAQNDEHELSTVHGLSDSVFANDDDPVRACETDYEDDETDGYGVRTITNKANRISYSDLEESDISENEADDDEDIVVDKDEFSRRLQQVSLVFETAKNENMNMQQKEPVSIIIDKPDDDNLSDASWSDENSNLDMNETNEYKYSEVLPYPFSECDLRLFSTLPHGMDWRAFIQPQNRKKKDGKNVPKLSYRKTDVEKRRLERKIREREDKKRHNLEELVDRIVMLEKLQTITVQYEQDRKRHIIHRAKSRNSARASSNNNTSQNTARTASPSTESPPPRPQSAKPTRRRSYTLSAGPNLSIPFSKPRRSISTTELNTDGSVNKLSPDIELVRLSCTKNHLQYVRHFSQQNKKRQRCPGTLPRYYDYTWSERLPPSKRLSLHSLNYTKPRNCHSCRESEKKLAHLHITQTMMGRPRSSFSTFSSEQQKLIPRPSSTGKPKIENKTADFSNTNKTKEKRNTKSPTPTSNNTISSTFGRPTPKTTSRTTQEKIFAAHAALSSVTRDYVKATRRTKSGRRGSAPMISAIRSAQGSTLNHFGVANQLNTLKPTVIDCANLNLR